MWIKIDSRGHYAFLNTFYLVKFSGTKQPLHVWNMFLFVPDNALSDVSGFNINWSKVELRMTSWWRCHLAQGTWIYRELVLDHLTESIHVAGRHYSSKDKLWSALADAFNDVSMTTTEKLTSSADNRLSFSLKTKVDTPTTYASPNDRKFSFKLKL